MQIIYGYLAFNMVCRAVRSIDEKLFLTCYYCDYHAYYHLLINARSGDECTQMAKNNTITHNVALLDIFPLREKSFDRK